MSPACNLRWSRKGYSKTYASGYKSDALPLELLRLIKFAGLWRASFRYLSAATYTLCERLHKHYRGKFVGRELVVSHYSFDAFYRQFNN